MDFVLIFVSVLSSQGALGMVEWFADIPRHAEIIVLCLSSAIISATLQIWKKRHHSEV